MFFVYAGRMGLPDLRAPHLKDAKELIRKCWQFQASVVAEQ